MRVLDLVEVNVIEVTHEVVLVAQGVLPISDYGDSLRVARLTFSLGILDCDAPAFLQAP